jgi:hypothetical protein
MTVHHQDNNYLTTEQLTEHRYTLSKDDKQTDHIIDRQTISDIDTRSTALKQFILRHNKTIKLQER